MIPLKKYIGKELPNYWVVNDVHYIVTMLHPNLKSFNHTSYQRFHAQVLLKSEFNKYQQLGQQQSSNNNNKRKRIQQQKNIQLPVSLDDVFDLPTSSNELQDKTDAETELDRYIEDETRIIKDMNVIIYWKDNKSSYPILAKIAKRILSIPTTNTSIERLVSDSRNTITNRRTRLQTSKVNQLLFIRRNLSKLRELFPPLIEQITRRNSSTSITPMKKPKHSQEDNVSQDDLANITFNDDGKENDTCDD